VTPLGATKARAVDIRLCAATLKDLRLEVAAGRFRQDLYYRIGLTCERIPALVERIEEIPWLVARSLSAVGESLSPSGALIEACTLRPWPGNVRELLAEIRQAGRRALAADRAWVEPSDLDPSAGLPVTAPEPRRVAMISSDEAILAALRRQSGNVTRAAALLGIHRNQLRRWIARRRIDPRSFGHC